MQCICEKKKQARRDDGKIGYYIPGDMEDFKVCPKGFRPVQVKSTEIDLTIVTEDELVGSDITVKKMKAFMSEKHPTVKVPSNIGRDKLIAKLIYARYNDESVTDTDNQPSVEDLT